MALVLADWSSSGAFAQAPETGKITFTDLRGREYKEAQILRIDPGTLVLMTDTGVARIPSSALPEELQKRFGIMDAAPTPAPMPPPSAPAKPLAEPRESNQLTTLDSKIAKFKDELLSLENGQRTLKAEYEKAHKAIKDLARKRWEAVQGTGKERKVMDPEDVDPDLDPIIARMKERLSGYAEQIKGRQDGLKDLERQRRGISDGVLAARRASEEAEAAARRTREDAEAAARRQQHIEALRMAREAEQRRENERAQHYEDLERARDARKKAELKAQEEAREKKLRAAEESAGKVRAMAASGRVGEAMITLQTLVADRDSWGVQGSPEAGRLCDAAMNVFGAARRADDLAVGISALQTALCLDNRSGKIVEGLLVFFDECKTLAIKGDFAGLARQARFVEDEGLSEQELCVRNRHELSDLAVTRGWQALQTLNLSRAGAAADAARILWDRNPRVGLLRLTVNAAWLLGIVCGFLVIATAFERMRWRMANRSRVGSSGKS